MRFIKNMFNFLFGKVKHRVKRKSSKKKINKRYNVPGSPCNRLKRASCRSNSSCSYTKRGCRRKRKNLLSPMVSASSSYSPVSSYSPDLTVTGPEEYSMSGDEDLGSYGDEGGISFFGKRRRRKTGCRLKRYNVPGSPCNRLKRTTCRSTKGCTYVKNRGCRRSKGFAKMVAAGMVPQVNSQVADFAAKGGKIAYDSGASPVDAAKMAGAAAADMASANVISSGGSDSDAKSAAIAAASTAVNDSLIEAGASSDDINRAIVDTTSMIAAAPSEGIFDTVLNELKNEGTYVPPEYVPPTSSWSNLSMKEKIAATNNGLENITAFGKKIRRCYFGNECKTFRDIGSCVNYKNGSGMLPCNWSGGKNSRCQKRPNPVSWDYAAKNGTYQSYIIAMTPSLSSMIPIPVPSPVAPAVEAVTPTSSKMVSSGNLTRGIFACIGRDQISCGSNPNCNWQSGAAGGLGRCIRQKGHDKGLQYEGPIGNTTSFGRRRYRTKRLGFGKHKKSSKSHKKTSKGHKKTRKVHKKPPASLLKKCKRYHVKITIKRGGKRVYKKISDLKKQLKKKIRKMKKKMIKRKVRKVRR